MADGAGDPVTAYLLVASMFRQIVERAPDGAALRVVKHRKGAIITDLDESEAQRLLLADAIIPVDDEDSGEVQDDGDGDSDSGQGSGDPGTTGSTGDQGDGDTPPVVVADGPPLKTAGVAEWRDYAVLQGLPKADAAELSRAELISRYGAR